MPGKGWLSSEVIFDGKIVRLRIDTVQTEDGRQVTREIIEHEEVIAVIPVDAEDNVLLVKQYRRAADREMLEIPAGGIDPGEDAEEAVIREMQEETGFRPQKLERLGGFFTSPGFCTEYIHLYLAVDLVPDQLHAEDTAGIEIVRVPISQRQELVVSGKIEDAKTIAGLLAYLEYRKTLEA